MGNATMRAHTFPMGDTTMERATSKLTIAPPVWRQRLPMGDATMKVHNFVDVTMGKAALVEWAKPHKTSRRTNNDTKEGFATLVLSGRRWGRDRESKSFVLPDLVTPS